MSILPAPTTVFYSHRLPATRVEGTKIGIGKLNGKSFSCYFKPELVVPFAGREIPALQSSRRRSSIRICASALNARCASEQTQTVTRKAPTMTHMPTKENLPDLDDGGTGFPPRDDGDGGGGGGGGGGNWSGGFFFFGFLAFLGFLKDKESEGPYDKRRRR